jgi:hypothetical protein
VTRVTIVSRTRMEDLVCVGGLTRDDLRNVRLLPPDGAHGHPPGAPYAVGQVWEMQLAPPRRVEAPHTEDALVLGGRPVATQVGLGIWLAANTSPWVGGADALFDGRLRLTSTGRAYLGRGVASDASVGFWLPDRDLELDETGRRYWVPWRDTRISVKFVGDDEPATHVPAGTLVRVSLSRWFMNPAGVYGCWLQISGTYPTRKPPAPAQRPTDDRPRQAPERLPSSASDTATRSARPLEPVPAARESSTVRHIQVRPPDPTPATTAPRRRRAARPVSYQVCLSCGTVLDADERRCWRCIDRD